MSPDVGSQFAPHDRFMCTLSRPTSDPPAVDASGEQAVTTMREAAQEFLAQKRIAVAGVSRDPKQPANLIYRRLRDTGHEVFAVNPNADEVEGDACYAAVTDIPGGVAGSSW